MELPIESVSEPSHADQKARLGWGRFNLASQIDDVGIDDAIGHVRVSAPRGIQQLVAAEDPPAALVRARSSRGLNGFVT